MSRHYGGGCNLAGDIFIIMNIKSLYHIIRKVIEPQYPWIDDFVWTQFYDGGYEYYILEITPKEGVKKADIFVDKYETQIGNEMKSLFDMLGPERYQKFYKVTIL